MLTMPQDVFISYSRKDSEHALSLAERLRAEGIQVWIDQHGIIGAEQWATEIVEGIKGCSTFILLISPDSVASENVLRELSLANESRKRILPVEIQTIELPSSFMYPLAGLQRVKIGDFEAIIRAHRHGVERVSQADIRKTLMILPFEDLSPTGDNEWFANGIAAELISALSNVKSLRVTDQQTTKEFKNFKGHMTTYAKEMSIRYFIQGSVRKFGDQIKITSALLDIETGDHLWQDSMKGTMQDIFDIQEKVAEKVVEGLKIHLASDEKKKLAERGTENAEAYELCLKAGEYFNRQTKEGFRLAEQLNSEAIALDPEYARAYVGKATSLASHYRAYDSDPKLLEDGLLLIQEAKRLKPDLWSANGPLSLILTLQDKTEEAEHAAREYIQNAPQDPGSYFSLGLFYQYSCQNAKAIAPFEEAVKLSPDYLVTLSNLIIACYEAKEVEKQKQWAEIAIPKYERQMKLFPENENNQVDYARILYFAGWDEDAKIAARKLDYLKDGRSLYNIACLHCMLKDLSSGLATFRKAIDAGYRNMRLLKSLLEDEVEGIGTLKGTPEYEEVKRMVEALE